MKLLSKTSFYVSVGLLSATAIAVSNFHQVERDSKRLTNNASEEIQSKVSKPISPITKPRKSDKTAPFAGNPEPSSTVDNNTLSRETVFISSDWANPLSFMETSGQTEPVSIDNLGHFSGDSGNSQDTHHGARSDRNVAQRGGLSSFNNSFLGGNTLYGVDSMQGNSGWTGESDEQVLFDTTSADESASNDNLMAMNIKGSNRLPSKPEKFTEAKGNNYNPAARNEVVTNEEMHDNSAVPIDENERIDDAMDNITVPSSFANSDQTVSKPTPNNSTSPSNKVAQQDDFAVSPAEQPIFTAPSFKDLVSTNNKPSDNQNGRATVPNGAISAEQKVIPAGSDPQQDDSGSMIASNQEPKQPNSNTPNKPTPKDILVNNQPPELSAGSEPRISGQSVSAVISEPATWAVWSLGLLGLLRLRSRR